MTDYFLRTTDKDGKAHGGFQWPMEVGATVTATERALRDITATDTQAAWAEYLRLHGLRQMQARIAATPTASDLRRAGDTVTRARMTDDGMHHTIDRLTQWVVVACALIIAACSLGVL
jgi:hypothetical protein